MQPERIFYWSAGFTRGEGVDLLEKGLGCTLPE